MAEWQHRAPRAGGAGGFRGAEQHVDVLPFHRRQNNAAAPEAQGGGYETFLVAGCS